jgi:predicted transcriptional regulator
MIAHDIVMLSLNQRKILSALAKTPEKEIQSAHFTSKLKISASSAQQAIDVLLQKDLLCVNHDRYYCLLDPAMKYYLNIILWESEG